MIVEAAKDVFDCRCIVRRCHKEKCSVKLDDAPTLYLLVDFDKTGSPLGEHETRCDYLFVADGAPGWVVPMELTTGKKRPTKAVEQLQAGADIANKKLPQNIGENVRFVPILVGKAKKHMRAEFKRKRIKFRGKTELIRRIGCGDALIKGLDGPEQ